MSTKQCLYANFANVIMSLARVVLFDCIFTATNYTLEFKEGE